jgi:quercetin dioxygenase-like cupin family protein
MKKSIFCTLAASLLLTNLSFAQETSKKTAPETTKFTIDNCINKFNKEKASKTAVGYQYWFVPQGFLPDGQTLKMSVVAPRQSTHAPHKHPGDEMFFVLEGTAQFYLNGKTVTGGPNTSFYCPEGSEHGISNAGDTELKYLVIRKYLNGEK